MGGKKEEEGWRVEAKADVGFGAGRPWAEAGVVMWVERIEARRGKREKGNVVERPVMMMDGAVAGSDRRRGLVDGTSVRLVLPVLAVRLCADLLRPTYPLGNASRLPSLLPSIEATRPNPGTTLGRHGGTEDEADGLPLAAGKPGVDDPVQRNVVVVRRVRLFLPFRSRALTDRNARAPSLTRSAQERTGSGNEDGEEDKRGVRRGENSKEVAEEEDDGHRPELAGVRRAKQNQRRFG
jgi:hypothetical protein